MVFEYSHFTFELGHVSFEFFSFCALFERRAGATVAFASQFFMNVQRRAWSARRFAKASLEVTEFFFQEVWRTAREDARGELESCGVPFKGFLANASD